ncbi:hypothetical protein [Hyalangium versicolor]|uniref:hypothetical protein n=1 Tax=Hyalangium versicolor TaxID=2861190 RepID=UPI001CC8FBDE|nr:hypothetical protein [Hyalangium versicolor]
MAIRTTSRPPPPPPPPPKKEVKQEPKKEVKQATSGLKTAEDTKKPADTAKTATATLTEGVQKATETAKTETATATATLPSGTTAATPAQPTQTQLEQQKDAFTVEGTAKRSAVSLLAKPEGTSSVDVLPEAELPKEIGTPTGTPQVKAAVTTPEVTTTQSAAVTTPNTQSAVTGEERAAQDVNVQTVADDRAQITETQTAVKNETTQQANDIIGGTGQLPEGASVTKLNDNEAELIRKDAQGNIVERTRATRGTDGSVSLESQGFKDGVNTRTRTEVTADGGTRVRNAQWESQASEMNTQPSLDDIEQSRDGKFTYSDNRVGEKDATGNWVAAGQGQLTVEEYAQSKGAVKGSETTYTSQNNKDYIDGYLQGAFKDGQIDRATTKTYSIEAPKEDGTQPTPQYQKIERFSQGDLQATSIVDKEMKNENSTDTPLYVEPGFPVEGHYAEYDKAIGNQSHNRADLANLRQEHKDSGWEAQFDANNDVGENKQPPKRWLVEMQKDPNTYASQTFVEGAPNASISTLRQRDGNTVKETYGGKTFSPDGKDLVDVNGSSTSKYGADGKLDQLDVTRVDRDGSSQESHYTRTAEQTAEGTRYTEKTDSKYLDKDNKQTTTKLDHVSLQTADGLKDISIHSEATNADGTAIHDVDANGDHLKVQAQGDSEPRDITNPNEFRSEQESTLAATAAAGSKALAESGVVVSGLTEKYLTAQAALGNKLGDTLNAAKGATKVFEGLVGATGIVAAGISMGQAVKDKDKAAIGLASTQMAGATMELTSAASAAVKPLSGLKAFEQLGAAGAVVGGAAGIWEGATNVDKGLETGLTGQIAKGGVDIVAGAGAIGAALLGAPVLGAAIGVGGFAIKSIIDMVADDQHQIGELRIDDEGFTPPQPQTPEQVAEQRHQEELDRQQAEEEAWLNAFANTNN